MDKKIKEINKKPEKQKVEKDVKKKVVRGSFSTLMIVLVVAIVVVLNIVASFVETDLGLKLDMTSNKIYTLSPLTESIVSQTDEELIIYSFANDNVQDNMIQKTLERYAALSSKISVKVADPAREVALQRKFSTDSVTVSNRTVVLSNKDETLFRVIPYTDMYYTDSENSVTYWVLEQKLTSAFMFMTSDIQTNVYLLTGHGELVTDPSYESATASLKARLEEENYHVETLDLAMQELKQGDILMVIGPATDLSEQERDTIVKFLDNRGKALFFLDPAQKELINFSAVLDRYMIKLKNQTVYESQSSMHTERSNFELVPDIVSGEITDGIINSGNRVYADSTVYFEEYNGTSDDITVMPLLKSSASSVSIPQEDLAAEQYLQKLGEYTQEERTVGLAFLQKDGSSMQNDADTRICVFGTSELVLGKRQNSAGNITLIKNCVNWVDNKTNRVAIQGPQMDAYTLSIYNASTVKTLVTVVIIVIPVLILGGGVFIWYRRKNL